ncbi:MULTISPECIES: hypothetical protein [unclassified Bartonella]|uniref:hypothetical protein n=1 Tax=unclassified Bartonella TaxID=2645622 RepID=UPI0035CE95DB
MGRSVLPEGTNSIEECEKQKHETMPHHYLKDISMNAFERCKAKLSGDDRFLPLRLYVLSKLHCLLVPEITQTDRCNIPTKSGI